MSVSVGGAAEVRVVAARSGKRILPSRRQGADPRVRMEGAQSAEGAVRRRGSEVRGRKEHRTLETKAE